jgi:hypothetical protein
MVESKEGETKMLIMKYERKDFFGHYQYVEDSKDHYKLEDVKKCFNFFGKEKFVVVQIENVIYAWDTCTDFENRVVLVRTYDDGRNYTETKKSFDLVKKEVYKTMKEA